MGRTDNIISAWQDIIATPAAKGLTVRSVQAMTDDDAYETFLRIRWPETDGEPVCPRCGDSRYYDIANRPVYRCKGCKKEYSVTSETVLHGRKMSIRDYLLFIATLNEPDREDSVLKISEDFGVQYKTAWLLSKRLIDERDDGDLRCVMCERPHDGVMMRTDRRYTRVRKMLRDECPHTSDGRLAICKGCQREAYFQGGFIKWLIKIVQRESRYKRAA